MPKKLIIAANPYKDTIIEYPDRVAWFFSPLFYRRENLYDLPIYFDNGAYSGLDIKQWTKVLDIVSEFSDWNVVPDAVGDHKETLRLWNEWSPKVPNPAFVAQDGCIPKEIPDKAVCLFVGGTTQWKLSDKALRCIKEAQKRKIHTHMGRVNTFNRIKLCMKWGIDSVDGSGFIKWPKNLDKMLYKIIKFEKSIVMASNWEEIMSEKVAVKETTQTVESIKSDKDLAIYYHQQYQQSVVNALEYAWKAGIAFNKVKNTIGHGKWTPWLKDVGIPRRTASRYMRLANGFQLSPANSFHSIGDAEQFIQQKKRKKQIAASGTKKKSVPELQIMLAKSNKNFEEVNIKMGLLTKQIDTLNEKNESLINENRELHKLTQKLTEEANAREVELKHIIQNSMQTTQIKTLGIAIPTNKPEVFYEDLLPSINHISCLQNVAKFLISFQEPWTQDQVDDVIKTLDKAGWKDTEYQLIPKYESPVSAVKMRNDAVNLDPNIDIYMMADDDFIFKNGPDEFPKSSGERYLEALKYMNIFPNCGVVMCASFRGSYEDGYKIFPSPSERGWWETGRGLFLRNMNKHGFVLAPQKAELPGGSEESYFVYIRMSLGYYGAYMKNVPTAHERGELKYKDIEPDDIHDTELRGSIGMEPYVNELWGEWKQLIPYKTKSPKNIMVAYEESGGDVEVFERPDLYTIDFKY